MWVYKFVLGGDLIKYVVFPNVQGGVDFVQGMLAGLGLIGNVVLREPCNQEWEHACHRYKKVQNKVMVTSKDEVHFAGSYAVFVDGDFITVVPAEDVIPCLSQRYNVYAVEWRDTYKGEGSFLTKYLGYDACRVSGKEHEVMGYLCQTYIQQSRFIRIGNSCFSAYTLRKLEADEVDRLFAVVHIDGSDEVIFMQEKDMK